jgi:hypothetical protein
VPGVARGSGAQRAVALRLDQSLAEAIPENAPTLKDVADALLAAGRIAPLDEAEFPAYVDKLRRSLPYWIYAIPGAETRRRLERQMFWDNYKGSTDLLTRYVFPPLVWPMTLFCTRWHIHPNVVTVLSIVLAFAAVPLFAQGSFVAGFACAYGYERPRQRGRQDRPGHAHRFGDRQRPRPRASIWSTRPSGTSPGHGGWAPMRRPIPCTRQPSG